jgi:hypothetical protein
VALASQSRYSDIQYRENELRLEADRGYDFDKYPAFHSSVIVAALLTNI